MNKTATYGNGKLIKIIIATFVLFALVCPVSAAAAADTYSIDSKHSSAAFTIRKLGVANIVGTFSDFSGTVVFSKENPSEDSMDISVGVASLNTRSERRDKLMKSSDFFDVEKYPTLRFKSSKIVKKKDGRYEVAGEFSLHGIKKNMTLVFEKPVEQSTPNGGRQVVLKTQFTIKRSAFGIKKDIPVIGDKVKISFSMVAVMK